MRERPSAGEQLRLYSDRLEMVRFLLIAMVVYVHMPLPQPASTTGGVAWLAPAYLLDATLFRFSVTALTVISGFLLFATQADRQPRRTFGKKVRTLVIPFLIWNVSFALAMYAAQERHVITTARLDLVHGSWSTWLDALFALRARPVNYPLYFLRDLFVINCLALVAGSWIRKHPITAICVTIAVADAGLVSWLILRTPMLPSFVIGAGLAIWNVPLQKIDANLPQLSMALALLCLLVFYGHVDDATYVVATLGSVTVWAAAGVLARSQHRDRLLTIARYAFPIYLLHSGILFSLLALGVRVTPTLSGLLIWLFAPALVILLSIGVFAAITRLWPVGAAMLTGGRAMRRFNTDAPAAARTEPVGIGVVSR